MTKRFDRLQFGFSRRTPLIYQGESSECGLACLAMVLHFHGNRTGLTSLRMRFPLSLKGLTLPNLIGIANALDLAARPLRVELEHLGELQMPCILHWDFNHFVVLTELVSGTATIHDPQHGSRSYSLDELSLHFTGVALELTPKPAFRRQRDPETVRLRDMLGKVVGLRRAMLQVFGLALSLEVFVLLAPFFNQWVVDQAIVAGDRDLLYVLAIGFGLLLLIRVAIDMLRAYVVMVLSASLNVQWLANVFQHLVSLPISYFERRHLGDVLSRFNSINSIQSSVTTGFIGAILDGIMSIGLVCMMTIYAPRLTAICLIAMTLYFILRLTFYGALRSASEFEIVFAARQQSLFMETIRGIHTLRIFGHIEQRTARWLNVVVDQKNCNLRTQRFSMLFNAGNVLLFGVENVLVLLFGALMVMDRSFSVGMLFAFITYKGLFSTRVSSFIDRMFEFRLLRLQSARLADIVLHPPEEAQHPRVASPERLESVVEIRDLHFRYAESDPWLIEKLDLVVADGESIAIVGPSGCGKTTLLKLLIGSLHPERGEIRIGGKTLKQIGLASYRQTIGVVMQDDTMFSGTIAENIGFFDPNHDQDWAEACARAAAIHDEIVKLPMGYSTLVGDMGSILSGGQRQRLLLARALYKRPTILFLDEATSHLDSDNEAKISRLIADMGMTRIVVAHRQETIDRCDRIVRLDAPTLTEAQRA
ncbi:peptidase domain-containing ABC transporter [Propionivibrio dicarboxylicus]|uniref:Cyclolysin secretion/processing ATP-binding protein CyaB n=1 Tax=Propionivibrio dicarboxylicus TaxID=83767 RepID=A0A1G8LR10_9RHOO|nr:peptidase domain-containing ABC transporter [Propionivibrio dicarboxylicus]SDI58055.1 ATP-binding cassette, subfamily B, RaxB [Propionivibrio dicarboxylicus]